MTLATSKDTKAGPSLVPVSGSPLTLESQNLSSNQRLVDKSKNGGDNHLDTSHEEIISTLAQRSGEHESGAQGEVDPSHSGVTVSAAVHHSKLAGSTTSRPAIVANGADASREPTCSPERAQTPSSGTAAPMQPAAQLDVQVTQNGPIPPLHPEHLNGQTNPGADPTPSANGQPHVNGNQSSSSRRKKVAETSRTSDVSMAVDDNEPPSRRTRSRNKRPPNVMAKEPAKRSRTSVDASSSAVNPSEPTSGARGGGSDDVQMRDPEPISNSSTRGPSPIRTQTSFITASQSTPLVTDNPVSSQPVSSSLDPNLDPALTSASGSQQPQSDSSTTPTDPHNFSDQLTHNENESSSTVSSEQTKPDTLPSSLANNPYLGLSTAFLKSSTSSGGAGFNPYALYYGPGTPITPHTPTYPYPYFYHLPSPLAAHAMYPASPTFPSSPGAQKSPPISTPSNGEPQRQKPKRLKAHTVTSGNHNIPIVPRDKQGKPMLPLNVGIMTVIRLGEVCLREHFHTERYIFPVGYEVTRRYLSTLDPNSEVVYHCTILDGGDGPKFQIVPSDVPDRTVIAGTATGAWSNIVKQANAIRSRQHSNSVSGPDFFGLGQNTIKHLIQELPNADRLRDYVWQNFIEGGPLGGRHAAVTPALPEDYDSTLPIGALYPSERERLKQQANSTPRGLNYYPQHIIAQAEAQRTQQQQQGTPQGSQQHDPSIDPSLSSASASTNGSSGQPPPNTGSATPQPPPAEPASDSQAPPPSSVPTTIAGIMSAYPVPVSASKQASPPATAAPPASASAPAPSASS